MHLVIDGIHLLKLLLVQGRSFLRRELTLLILRSIDHDVSDLVLVVVEHVLALRDLILQVHELVVHDEARVRGSAVILMAHLVRLRRLVTIDRGG